MRMLAMLDNCVPWRQLDGCSVTRPFLSAKGVACETIRMVGMLAALWQGTWKYIWKHGGLNHITYACLLRSTSPPSVTDCMVEPFALELFVSA